MLGKSSKQCNCLKLNFLRQETNKNIVIEAISFETGSIDYCRQEDEKGYLLLSFNLHRKRRRKMRPYVENEENEENLKDCEYRWWSGDGAAERIQSWR